MGEKRKRDLTMRNIRISRSGSDFRLLKIVANMVKQQA